MTSTTQEKATVTAIAKPRTSRASRGAAQAKNPAKASNAKRTTTKSTATKNTTKVPAKAKTPATPKGPSDRELRQRAIRVLVDAGAEIIRTWRPADHGGVSKETAREAIRQALGYTPAEAGWSYDTPHPVLGVRDVGRPRPAVKSTK
jgi:hypothetical protein